MPNTLSFDTTDSSLLSAVLKAQSSSPTQLAPRCELWSWAKEHRTANPNESKDELVHALVAHKNELAAEMAGHKKFPYDIPDDQNQLLGLADGASKFIPEGGIKIAEGVVGLGKAFMELTPVEEWVKNYHAENAADATANIVAGSYRNCDQTVADVVPMLRDDPVFNQALATVDPDAAASGATIPTAPGDVLQAHDEVFSQTIIKQNFTVQVDSGLLAQIDDVQQTLSDQMSGISTQMQEQYKNLHDDIAKLQAGQKTLLAYVSDQQERQKQASEAAQRKAQYEAVFAGAQTAVNVLATVAV
ncbi:hypothetical protein [Ktedonobacter robiniae]|uniref:Uncharacterized protein n=1 Tax=Ktedonobacter robiniae TaxID=2778365 RepID=A0ABQ3V159_9CHLR|nr:hypothetical protein [Ktedonobacter robiniae]GHO58317.1 hypothetical protein KSB_67920 [Ktedonobacter robiniae]